MQHIQGISRNQLQIVSLEDKITPDNPIRFIDAFVNHIDLNKIGFESKVLKTEGRPSFQTQVFLKLYLYGYLNGVRSSRRLRRYPRSEAERYSRKRELQFQIQEDNSLQRKSLWFLIIYNS